MAQRSNILITGGTGLIGKELVSLLINRLPNSNIIATYHSRKPVIQGHNLAWIKCDLANLNKKSFKDFIFDKVIHLAAFLPPGRTNPDDFAKTIFLTNILGTIRLFDFINLRKNAHIVYVSSAAVYRSTTGKFKETDKICPPHISGAYAYSKIYIEWYLSECFRRLAIVRPSYVYGPGMDKKKLLPRLLRQAMQNKVLSLKPPFNMLCDYIHSKDVSGGIYAIIRRSPVGIYNLGSGVGVNIEKLARCCIEVAKKGKFPRNPDSVKKNTLLASKQLLVDITKAKNNLQWSPKIKLREGLKDLLNWLAEENKNEE